jgi:hypothetical protein
MYQLRTAHKDLPSRRIYGASTPILTLAAGHMEFAKKISLSPIIGIVDTGSTLILLVTEAYNAYATATGTVLDSKTGWPFLVIMPLFLLMR